MSKEPVLGACPVCGEVLETNWSRTHGYTMPMHYIRNTKTYCDGAGLSPLTTRIAGVKQVTTDGDNGEDLIDE